MASNLTVLLAVTSNLSKEWFQESISGIQNFKLVICIPSNPMRQRLRQMRLAHAGRPAQDDVAPVADEVAGGQRTDLLAVDGRVELEVEVIPDDGAWFVQIRELPGCMTEVDEWEEILPAIEDAKRLWIELALERGRPIPEPMGVVK